MTSPIPVAAIKHYFNPNHPNRHKSGSSVSVEIGQFCLVLAMALAGTITQQGRVTDVRVSKLNYH